MRLDEPATEEKNRRDAESFRGCTRTKSHRAFGHQRDSADLHADGDVRADEARGRGEEDDDAQV